MALTGTARTIISAAAVALVTVVIIGHARSSSSLRQPIEYNHKKHIAMGLVCDNCHLYTKSQAFAGMPGLAQCAPCHQAPVGSVEAKKVTRYVRKGQEIPWVRIHAVPGHVYFSHRRHTVVAKLECSTCHGHPERQSKPVTAPAVKMSMEWCMDCHEARRASLDCNACHR